MAKVIYQSKRKLYPAFGDSNIKKNTIYIRRDLPKIVKKFVKEHELYHLRDKSTNGFWREIKANVYGLFRRPIGFLICAFMSLAPYRLKFYFYRFRKRE